MTRHLILFVLLALLTACSRGPEVIKDLSGSSFELVNQDSAAVTFPDDFKGKVTIVGFIYTHCPDVCPITTANMNKISKQLESEAEVAFVGISFDPKRDTPSVLKDYMEQFKLDEQRFTFLTGDTTTVDSLLSSMNIRAQVSYTKTTDAGQELYFMTHTDRITLIDDRGRMRAEYPGSRVPVEHVVEDINRIR